MNSKFLPYSQTGGHTAPKTLISIQEVGKENEERNLKMERKAQLLRNDRFLLLVHMFFFDLIFTVIVRINLF